MTNVAAPTVPRRLLPILMIVVPLSQIPLDVYTPAMPEMVADLNSSANTMQNTVTAYMLGMAVAFLPVGVLADAHGRKRVLLSCLGLVVLTSLGCAAVDDVTLLLVLRFVQGAAACSALVLSYSIAADMYRGNRLTAVAGMLGAAWGLAPVLAPAVGGVFVQFVSWRWIFVALAVLAAVVAGIVALWLPETLAPDHHTPVDLRRIASVTAATLRHKVFVCFVGIFGLMASAQLAFGVAGPFLYQVELGFEPATYGLFALLVGAANLMGELACGSLAARITTRQLAVGAWIVFTTGAAVLVISAATVGVNTWAITIGAFLALGGCGVLCPQMYGLALGLFSRNLGLVGGIVTAVSYVIVSAAMATVGVLPEESQAPLGWLYVAIGASVIVPIIWASAPARSEHVEPP